MRKFEDNYLRALLGARRVERTEHRVAAFLSRDIGLFVAIYCGRPRL